MIALGTRWDPSGQHAQDPSQSQLNSANISMWGPCGFEMG